MEFNPLETAILFCVAGIFIALGIAITVGGCRILFELVKTLWML